MTFLSIFVGLALTLRASGTGGYQGLSFAIPIDVANKVQTQLVAHGKVTRGRLGVAIQDVNQALADSFSLKQAGGALVASVEKGSPAEKAGVEAGDVIVAVDGRKIDRSAELSARVSEITPGAKASLDVIRNGENKSFTVVIGEAGSRTTNGTSVSAKEILNYSRKLRKLEFLSEFVCSELFLPMSVSNHNVLATELQKLARRFGSDMSIKHAQDSVIGDVELMSNYLGSVDPSGPINRRSIFIVPAMTSRSADYWIFGQAALLSGGTTTVFCNAVKKKYSVGGSCFIGRDSWSEGTKPLHQDATVTPYAGWSKGIFYHQKIDALGATEQAVVIADIDPSFMQEGKPRPQALAVPLQLVAYLPIAEVRDENAYRFCKRMTDALNELNITGMAGRIVNPSEPGLERVMTLISKRFDSNEGNPFSDRFEHWKKFWRANPAAGVPAALVDWLWVDTTSTDIDSVQLFVPSCAGESSTPPGANDNVGVKGGAV